MRWFLFGMCYLDCVMITVFWMMVLGALDIF